MNILLPTINEEFIEMSLKINKEFRLAGYNHKKVIKSDLYIKYKEKYLEAKELLNGY